MGPYHLTLLLLLCSFCGGSESQTPPPLQGQGIDPFTAKLVSSPVPVYTSVELVKLLEVQEQAYTFTALLLVNQVWEDPRADSAFQVINSLALNSSLERTRAQQACASQAKDPSKGNVTIDVGSLSCSKALRVGGPETSCSKYCTTYGEGVLDRDYCCDIVWLPDVEVRNLVTATRDRVALDKVESVGSNRVNRVTRVLGTFTAPLDFGHYPFDKQMLTVYINPNPYTVSSANNSGFTIVPSATFRRVNLIYTAGANRSGLISGSTSDELAGWRIESFSFSCTNLTSGQRAAIDKPTQEFDPADPTLAMSMKQVAADGLHEMCALTIQVSRMSNTAVVSSILPVAFCSVLAFVALFTEPDQVDTRLGTLISLFLAITAVQFVFVSMLPLTSSCNYLDIFILLSYTLVVSIVLESLVVYYISTRGSHKERRGHYVVATLPRVELGSMGKGLVFPSTKKSRENNYKTQPLQEELSEGICDSLHKQNSNHVGNEEQLYSGELRRNTRPTSSDEVTLSDQQERQMPQTETGVGAEIAQGGELSTPRLMESPGSVQGCLERLEADPQYAYCLARKIDIAAGVFLALLYTTLAILNFTVGLS